MKYVYDIYIFILIQDRHMSGYIQNIEQETLQNENFRKVVYTWTHMQLVVMSLQPQEEIGLEVHHHEDQFIRVEQGEGKAILWDQEHHIAHDIALIIPAGMKHNVINTSTTETLKLYTIYAPSHHPENTIHVTKKEADEAEEHHH